MAQTRKQPQSKSGDAVRVFVSYSRKDAGFVERLERRLKARGIETLFDREQIASFEDWRERIRNLVGQAHTVLVVLSPDWLQSKECRKELDLALEMNKRLAPVLYRSVSPHKVPPALARPNWFFLQKETDFAVALRGLVAAFETDIEWLREQARISEQAMYWQRDDRPEGALLRDQALVAAERWLSRRPANAPTASALLSEYLQVGREVHEREEKARRDLLDRTLISQSLMLSDRARQMLDAGDVVSAILLCLEALPDENNAITRPYVAEAETICYNALCLLREHRVLSLPDKTTWDIAVSDDGTRLAALVASGVTILETETGGLLASFSGDKTVFSKDGKVVVMFDKKDARLWNLSSQEEGYRLLKKFPITRHKALKELLPQVQNAWIEYGASFELVRNKTARMPLPLCKSLPIRADIERAAFSEDGERIATTPAFTFDFPTTVHTWNARNGRKIADLKGHKAYVRSAEFSPNGEQVATAAADKTARIWDAKTGKPLMLLKGHDDDVACARFSPNGSLLVTGSYDNSFRVWDTSSGENIAVLRGHSGEVPKTTDIFKGFLPRARFTPDGSQIITIWNDRTARIWSLKAGTGLHSELTGHQGTVNSVSFHPDGNRFFTASDDTTIRVWDTKTKMCLSVWCELDDEIRDVAVSPDGTTLAAAVGNQVILWALDSGQELTRIGTEETIYSLAFSPAGDRVGTAFLDEGVAVWSLRTGEQVSHFEEGASGYCVQFAPSGLVVASCGDERALRLWNPDTGRQIGAVVFQGHSLLSVAFDNKGRRIVAGSDDRTARVWNVGSEPSDENVVVLSGHDQGVNSATFSPSGARVVTASQDGTVRLWNSTTGENLAVFRGHSSDVRKAVFSPAGDEIVSVSADKTIRVWKLFPKTQALVDYARNVVPRGLTRDQRKAFFLDPEPPAWYAHLKKWPYL